MRLVRFQHYRNCAIGALLDDGRLLDLSAAAAAWLWLDQADPMWEGETALRLPADVGVFLVDRGVDAPPSSLDTEMYRVLVRTAKTLSPRAVVVPRMSTGATDMAFVRAKGMQCYGVSLATDEEDTLKGFAAHSDQERVLEDSLYKFLQFQWEVLTTTAFAARR